MQIVVSGLKWWADGEKRALYSYSHHPLSVFSCSHFFAPASQWSSLNAWKRQAKCKSMKGNVKNILVFSSIIRREFEIKMSCLISMLYGLLPFGFPGQFKWFHSTRLIRHANDFTNANSHARRKRFARRVNLCYSRNIRVSQATGIWYQNNSCRHKSLRLGCGILKTCVVP